MTRFITREQRNDTVTLARRTSRYHTGALVLAVVVRRGYGGDDDGDETIKKQRVRKNNTKFIKFARVWNGEKKSSAFFRYTLFFANSNLVFDGLREGPDRGKRNHTSNTNQLLAGLLSRNRGSRLMQAAAT